MASNCDIKKRLPLFGRRFYFFGDACSCSGIKPPYPCAPPSVSNALIFFLLRNKVHLILFYSLWKSFRKCLNFR